MKKVSLADIANSLGVSKTLVSMVLNGKGDQMGISKRTQEKVMAKAKEMKYRPNHFARGLRSGKSNTIGLVISDISNPFYAEICKAVETTVRKNNRNLLICSTNEETLNESNIIEMMVEKQVDGVIISSSQKNVEAFEPLKEAQIPIVFIDRKMNVENSGYVGVNNVSGSMQITDHLFSTGKENIGFITIGPAHASSLAERKEGFSEALMEHAKIPEEFIFEFDFHTFEDEINAKLTDIIKNHNLDAIYTANNNIAKVALKTLRKNNVLIGKDIAFASFDDIPLFELLSPGVTAVRQPVSEIGVEAVKILNQYVDEQKKGNLEKILSTELIIRESSQ